VIKNKSELSDHIYTLIKSGELSFQTYSDWLSWGYHVEIYERFAEENYEKELQESVNKEHYVNYLREQLLYLTSSLYDNSSHSTNELRLMEVKALSRFLIKICRGK
jgi:hypothetical protein